MKEDSHDLHIRGNIFFQNKYVWPFLCALHGYTHVTLFHFKVYSKTAKQKITENHVSHVPLLFTVSVNS